MSVFDHTAACAGSARNLRRPRDAAHSPSRPWTVALLLLAAAAAGCGGETGPETHEVRRDTVGDTVVVRNPGGSVWGDTARLVEEVRIGRLEGPEAYTFGHVSGLAAGPGGSVFVVDRQVPALREYGPDGRHGVDFGRPGGGPGEIGQTMGGVAVLPDGRVALRDRGNARIQLYHPDGKPAGSVPVRGNFFTSRPLFADTAGRIWHWVSGRPDGSSDRYVVFDPDERARDTVPVPTWGEAAPSLRAAASNRRRIMGVPFWPGDRHTVSPLGYLVGGSNDECSFELLRASGPVRVVREARRAPVLPGEREAEREDLVEGMREVEPGWSWSGPDIPERKPCYRTILAGSHGRTWLVRHTAAERIEPPDRDRERAPGEPSPERALWREPLVFDVYAPDGRYLGAARPATRIETHPWPVIRGDTVWAVARDELDVPHVVRLQLVRPDGTAGDTARGG